MITISKRSHHLICSPRSGINYASVGFTGQIVNVKDQNLLLLDVQKKKKQYTNDLLQSTIMQYDWNGPTGDLGSG